MFVREKDGKRFRVVSESGQGYHVRSDDYYQQTELVTFRKGAFYGMTGDVFRYEDDQSQMAQKLRAAEAEVVRLRAAIEKHRDNFPDEPLDGELELWSVLGSDKGKR